MTVRTKDIMLDTDHRHRRYRKVLGGGVAAAVGALMLLPAATNAQAVPDRWDPQVGETFSIQYTGSIDLNRDAQVYNLDWENTSASQVKTLQGRGVHVVCYFSAGSSEDWRSDDDKFPASVKGQPLDGWDGENWLDIRQLDTLMPILEARMDVCAQKGFDAVDPDNTDAWSQDTGFPITKSDQVAYQRAMADAAHERGLAIGLKNNVEQVPQMASFVDFAVNEECNEWDECDAYEDFLAAGKPVYNIEYTSSCPSGLPAGMSSFIGDYDLGPGGTICNEPPSTATPAPAPTRTATPAPTRTATPAPTRTATPAPTRTATPAPTRTATPAPTRTATPAPTRTATTSNWRDSWDRDSWRDSWRDRWDRWDSDRDRDRDSWRDSWDRWNRGR